MTATPKITFKIGHSLDMIEEKSKLVTIVILEITCLKTFSLE